MNLKKIIKDWFTLSSRERTGIMVLLVLIIFVLIINLFLRYYPYQQESADYAGYYKELELFRNSLHNSAAVPDNNLEKRDAAMPKLFLFDPNTATNNEMVSLGMKERIASRIISYREKGGRFHEKEDLLKIYGFGRTLYTSLAPYINIAKKEVPVRNYNRPAEEFLREHPVEINSSDTSALISLRGIGPVLASRIIKYRGILGGFYSIDQLKEVYGISDSLFQAIREYVYIDTSLVRKISINEVSEIQLSRHPYIGRYTAMAIVSYRKTSGCILSTEELVRNKIIPEEQKGRMKAYLSFDIQNPDFFSEP
jgi:competence protein ComEA